MAPDVDSFDQFPQPPWNAADSIERALEQVGRASSESEAAAAYDRLLYAVGNNHAGTYYPVVLAVVTDLGFQIDLGSVWPQFASVQALLDLTGSFGPEPGFELYRAPGEGAPSSLRGQLRRRVRQLTTKLERLASHGRPASAGAAELLELVRDEA